MKNKGALLFWLDVINAVLLLALLFTGSIMKWVLPPGSGGRPGGHAGITWLGLHRHDWGDVHLWIAFSFVAGIGLHLLLHAGWVSAAARRFVLRRGVPRRA